MNAPTKEQKVVKRSNAEYPNAPYVVTINAIDVPRVAPAEPAPTAPEATTEASVLTEVPTGALKVDAPKVETNESQSSSPSSQTQQSEEQEPAAKKQKTEITYVVGQTYMCQRTSAGQLLPAVLVKKKDDEDMFYVHYVDMDRRLDEWVSKERLGEIFVANPRSRRTPKTSTTAAAATAPAAADDDETNSRKRVKSHHAMHEMTKVRNIGKIQLGKHEIECWYFSPYPGKFGACEKLYICERSLKYFDSKEAYAGYQEYVKTKTPESVGPPGKLIYHEPERSLRVYEIDGGVDRLYGQNLCLFGKLFIEHKTLSFDPAPFFFYVLYEEDEDGLHPVGYFSKEKTSKEKYNLACIVTLPPYQRKGYGKFIISLSYELTKLSNAVGSPEKPLSDLGKLSYRSYWSYVLLDFFSHLDDSSMEALTLDTLALATGIKPEDMLSTLQSLHMIHHLKGQFVIKVNRDHVKKLLSEYDARKFASAFCKPNLLKYNPKKKL